MVHLLNMWDEMVIVYFEIIGFLPFKIIVTCKAMPYLTNQAQMTMAASTSLCKHMDKAISCIQEKLVADWIGNATRGMNMSGLVEVWSSCKALTWTYGSSGYSWSYRLLYIDDMCCSVCSWHI